MKVLHLWEEFEPNWFDHSFEICRDEGIDVRFITMRLILPAGKVAGEHVEYVRKIVPGQTPPGTLRRAIERLRQPWDAHRFRKAARRAIGEFGPDVIHCHYGTTAAILLPVLAKARTPFVLSFYGYDISQGLRDARTSAAYRRLVQLDCLLHVLCDETASRVRALGAGENQIVKANLPLPVERYPFIGLKRASISHWLIPARFVEKKGHAVLLDAFRLLVDKDPRHHLTCWGGYGEPGRVRAQIEQLGLGDHVKVLSNKQDGPFDGAYVTQLERHDVILAPSIRSRGGDDEGGPALTAVLAQVAGKPVIFSDFPGSECSVTDGVEGMIVRQNDPAALAEAMLAMARDPVRAVEMGKAGRERTLREFSRNSYRDALLSWYGRLAGSSKQ
jgi:glycosyltransferase involved in cell wall biosynthesis